MYKPLLISLGYVASLVGIIEAKEAEMIQSIFAFLIGFSYFLFLQMPMLFAGYSVKTSGFIGFLRPIYLSIPIAICYSLALPGLLAVPFVFHAIGTLAFTLSIAVAVYKAHISHNYVKILEA